METKTKIGEMITQSITLKVFIIGILSIMLLIPGIMVQELIRDRQERSQETIHKINDKWSHTQTLCAPILSVPYITSYINANEKAVYEHHVLHITPEVLNVDTELFPEERHYGIYKTILYKSKSKMSGQFEIPDIESFYNSTFQWDRAYIRLGLSDMRGITNNIEFILNDKPFSAVVGNGGDALMGKELIVNLDEAIGMKPGMILNYECVVDLNGSSSFNYIPIGKTTNVNITGAWENPGYIGNFSPEHTITKEGFEANWNVLRFNRNIPETWSDNTVESLNESSFGVSLVDTVDHYQQNMRSAKYAFMFIALTFVVFLFVELLTKRRIHPMQYILVGIAFILFYSLLLSISEQIGFGWAYIIASIAIISLITLYTKSIFKSWKYTGILTATLCALYTFLYTLLQLEDIALLIGSIGLFVILAIIMYCSRKINWYKTDSPTE